MPLTDVAAAIDSLAFPVTRRRHIPTGPSGLYDSTGRWNEASPENIPPEDVVIQAFISSMQPHQVMDLPEGIRADATCSIWTRDELQAPDDTQGLIGDQIQWHGEWYRVLLVWPRREGAYTKAVLGAIRDRGRTAHSA